jgi:hypothetical protein
MDKKHKQIALASAKVLGAVLLLGGSFAAGAYSMPREVTKIVPGPTEYVDKIVEIPGPEVTKTVEIEVPVDNGNLKIVLDELIKTDGNVEYLVDDLDDDEVEMIVDRLFLKQEWEYLAEQEIRANLYEELDEETVGTVELDERDMSGLRIDVEDFTYEDIDWTEKDADVVVPFKARQDDFKFEGVAIVQIREGKVDELIIDSVQAR